jgi:hypothetical protein
LKFVNDNAIIKSIAGTKRPQVEKERKWRDKAEDVLCSNQSTLLIRKNGENENNALFTEKHSKIFQKSRWKSLIVFFLRCSHIIFFALYLWDLPQISPAQMSKIFDFLFTHK